MAQPNAGATNGAGKAVKRRKQVALGDVARAAGVSISTVSRALNGSVRVSPELERRIRDAAAQLGVRTSAQDRQRLLAFLLSNRSIVHPFHSHVMAGAQAFCAEHAYDILFLPVQYSVNAVSQQLPALSLLKRRRLVDGVVLSGVTSPSLLQVMKESGIPFAVFGNTVVGEWNVHDYFNVTVDDDSGAAEVTRYLIGLGHQAIWFVGNSRWPWLERRYAAFRRTMEAAGLEAPLREFDSPDEREIGYVGVKTILERGDRVTAVFAGTDSIAQGVYEALRDRNLAVGKDVSVAGFNEQPEALVLHPGLTTVRVFPELVGKQLAAAVLNQIETGCEAAPQQAVIPVRLIKRESCLPVPARDGWPGS